MEIVTGYQLVSAANRGASAAIGNFDGVHRGHQAVIALARQLRPDAPLGVVSFEPHPRTFFAPNAPAFRLTNALARRHRLEKLGVAKLYELPFDQALAQLSPRAFARDVLQKGLGLAHAVVGADFRFGRGRAGTADDLAALGVELGFGVQIAPLVQAGQRQISSTNIRQALTQGDPQGAAAMLGHWHRIEGPVIEGAQRGRQLGFPTANMCIDGLHPPRFGVYATLIDVLDGPHKGRYHGASSIGIRPMFNAATTGTPTANLENFLFDFTGDLYGATLSVGLVAYLRPEQEFPSLGALSRQMAADCTEARALLASLPRAAP